MYTDALQRCPLRKKSLKLLGVGLAEHTFSVVLLQFQISVKGIA